MARHGGRNDERTEALFFEFFTDGFGAVEGTGQVGVDDFIPFVGRAVKDAFIGGAACVGDEGVDLAVSEMKRVSRVGPIHGAVSRERGISVNH